VCSLAATEADRSLPRPFAGRPSPAPHAPPPPPTLLLFRAITPNNWCALLRRSEGVPMCLPHNSAVACSCLQCSGCHCCSSFNPPAASHRPRSWLHCTALRSLTQLCAADRRTLFGAVLRPAVSQQGDLAGGPKNSSPKGRHSTKTLPFTPVPYV
jgi:hypothetical protein